MKMKILSFVFTFVSLCSFGQTIQLITTNAPLICNTSSVPSCIFSNINTPGTNAYSLVPTTNPYGIAEIVGDAGSNAYGAIFLPAGGGTIRNIIYRKNNVWKFVAYQNATWIPAPGVLSGIWYQTSEGGNLVNPPCIAEWAFSSGNFGSNNNPSYHTLEFTGLGCATPTMYCNTETSQKLINLAAVSGTVINAITAADGLREGSLIYNQSHQQVQLFNGYDWGTLYSNLHSINIREGNSLNFNTSGNSSPQLYVDPTDIYTLRLSANFLATQSTAGTVVATNRLDSKGAFFEKVHTFAEDYIVTDTDHNLIFNGVTTKTLTIWSWQNVLGRVLFIKNLGSASLTMNPGIQFSSGQSLTSSLPGGSTVKIIYNGTNWVSVAGMSNSLSSLDVTGATTLNTLTVTGNLKSNGSITEKATFFGNVSAILPAATSVIVFNGSVNTSLTIPSASTYEVGRIYTIKNLTSASTITLSGSIVKSTATVNVTSLTAGQSIRIMSDGTNWITI